MGTISPRKRRDGTTGYTAQIRIKRSGKIAFTETQTFERRAAATSWLKRRESELASPGGIERAKQPDPPLHAVIERYFTESEKEIGRTKRQVLNAIKASDFAELACSRVNSAEIIGFARTLNVLPQTVANYLSHLGAVMAVARPAWGYPLEPQAIRDALTVAKRLGLTSKSRPRGRRPTLAELDTLMSHFAARQIRHPESAPMETILAFAIFSTRRQEEITRIQWADLDKVHSRILVRDMKNPGEKRGNDVWCSLPPEALRVIEIMPRTTPRIFPFTVDAIGASFTRAVHILGIEDLHFHDLRHEGVSRLFELGWSIPRVADVSGHRSWQSLQRYTHLRETGDKFAGWRWLANLNSAVE